MRFGYSLLLGMLLVGFASVPSRSAVLTNGSLTVAIEEGNGAIGEVSFGGSDFYNPGTPVSDYGFQAGTSTSTFSIATTVGSLSSNISISSVSTVGDAVVVRGRYTGGATTVDFTRTYSLIRGTNALQVEIELTNSGISNATVRWYETFDPDQGYDHGRGHNTFNDVLEIIPGVSVGQATDTGGLSVVMGSPESGSVVASGSPFRIDSGAYLNSFFDNPFDGEGNFDDSGTHVGGTVVALAPASSATIIYYHGYGLSEADARSAYLDALVNSRCFAIDAIDDEFSVINDGTTVDIPVLENDECKADTPISVIELPGDLLPDRGGSATTDGDTVTYTPAIGFVGFEEFTYTAQDAGLDGGADPPAVDQDTAAVVVNVLENLIPDAVDDVATTLQDQALIIDVLENDSLGNAPNAVEIKTEPTNGSATVQPDDTIEYSPNFEFFGEDSFEYRLTDANGDSDVATVTVGVFFVRGQVSIDIMPKSDGNNLNLRAGQGAGIEVAILSVGEFFEAPALIDPLTLKFGPREGNIWGGTQVRDVDADGDDDLVVKFLIQQSGIACGDPRATVSGRTFGAQSISGTDAINTFNCPRVRKRH